MTTGNTEVDYFSDLTVGDFSGGVYPEAKPQGLRSDVRWFWPRQNMV